MADQHTRSALERLLLLEGRTASFAVQGRSRIRHLGDVEFRVTSQWGEDGIIEWLCHNLPECPRSFIEFGVETYAEANTRFLLQNRGWRGLILDGDPASIAELRTQELIWRHHLTAGVAFITRENINAVIARGGFGGDIGLLSVDIDGADYWVLEAIDVVRPVIIICEFNGLFGDLRRITVPYRPDFQRMKAHYSGQYFGCSIGALKSLCARKGYSFIGTTTSGVNAVFVRDDLAGPVLDSIDEVKIWPPGNRDSRDAEGRMNLQHGLAKLELIADLPVVDLESGETVPLRTLQPLCSDAYLAEFS